jgi:tRNA (cytidine/uridine-2'-O-)-methyltransferase
VNYRRFIPHPFLHHPFLVPKLEFRNESARERDRERTRATGESIAMFHIVLYEPEIHANAGNVGRTCVALGAKLWLVRPLGFRLDDHHLRRAGLDYWEHLDWEAVDNWQILQNRLPPRRPWFFSKSAVRPYTEAVFQPGDVLVFGSETRGLPSSLLEANADRSLRIPICAAVRSLNLAVTVGIAAYEALRQCGGIGTPQGA